VSVSWAAVSGIAAFYLDYIIGFDIPSNIGTRSEFHTDCSLMCVVCLCIVLVFSGRLETLLHFSVFENLS
jgi:hypothetical protein